MIQQEETFQRTHIKLGVIGNVDAGKSTLVSVLTKGIPDDGNGSARTRVFNFQHQQQTGRTSSIGQEILGFNEKGEQVLPQRFNIDKNKYWKQIMKSSTKVVSIVDLCGHEKYLKTTINGLTGLSPDFGCVIVGANAGVQKMTREHIALCLFLRIPFMVIITKVDFAPKEKYEETLTEIKKLMKHKMLSKQPIIINDKISEKDYEQTLKIMHTSTVCPIFSVSSVTKQGLPKLIDFISKLKVKVPTIEELKQEPFEFQVNETFFVKGVGLILSGIVKSGMVHLNQECLLGPDRVRNFKAVSIKSIHVSRTSVEQAVRGQLACICAKAVKADQKLEKKEIRRGMVVLNKNSHPKPVTRFEATLQVLHNPTTIKVGYEGIMHCGTIQQAVTLMEINSTNKEDDQILRSGDHGTVIFKFKYISQFIKEGEIVLLREGKTKIIGTVTKIIE